MKPCYAPLFAALLATCACGRSFLDEGLADAALPDASAPPDAGPPPSPATTVLEPPPGPFNGQVTVTLSTDKPATLFFTLDASDPKTSSTRRFQASPVTLKLQRTTTVGFFSRTDDGADEDSRSVVYVRAGGPKGTVSGVVVVDGTALHKPIGVAADLSSTVLGTSGLRTEMPFRIEGLATGTHRLVPFADLNGDNQFMPLVDLAGPTFGFALDLNDPFKASLEDVRLYLGASQPGLCTLRGTVSFPEPVPDQNLSVAALDPAALQGGAEPRALLAAFSSGFRVVTNATDRVYPYEILDLAPGTYLPVPALVGASGGLSLNMVADLGGARSCAAGGTVQADLAFGQVTLNGAVVYTPPSPAPFAWGAVVARSWVLSGSTLSAQIVLMPTVLFPSGPTELRGGFSAVALRDGETFDLRVFTDLDSGATDPLTAALAWAAEPMPELPAQGFVLAEPPSVEVTLTAP